MSHVKSNDLTREDLEKRLKETPAAVVPKYRARIFLDLYWKIHHAWNARLAAEESIDFDDMLLGAIRHLEAGDVDPGYQLVLVDEFQDASHARSRLTHGLVDHDDRYLLAVGDDFQAINRFAGADLGAMLHFHEWFGAGPTVRLETTFRSTQAICDTATSFVQANPAQLTKTVHSAHRDTYGPPVTLMRVATPEDVATAIRTALETIAEQNSDSGQPVTVDVLGRYGFDADLLPRRIPAGLKVQFRTIHASKGLEADYVIVPNLQTGRFGFPSEISDDPILSLAMADADLYPHAEERRLFYVALTRAKKHVTLITVQGRESPFVVELLADGRLEERTNAGVEPAVACPECRQGLLVRRTRHSDGAVFYGCSRFPKCRGTRRASQPAF
jgi:DNA helicase-4